MFWQEETQTAKAVHTEAVIVSMAVDIKALPVDHTLGLSQCITRQLPYLEHYACAGIHAIYGAESGNGWERASAAEDIIYPSRRTRLQLQVPGEIAEKVMADLDGFRADLFGETLTLSKPTQKAILKHGTIFARYVVSQEAEEEDFLQTIHEVLQRENIMIKKMLCGKGHTMQTQQGPVLTRSLMLADLELNDALALQACGIGAHKLLGCGLFLPHKTVEDSWSNTQ